VTTDLIYCLGDIFLCSDTLLRHCWIWWPSCFPVWLVHVVPQL